MNEETNLRSIIVSLSGRAGFAVIFSLIYALFQQDWNNVNLALMLIFSQILYSISAWLYNLFAKSSEIISDEIATSIGHGLVDLLRSQFRNVTSNAKSIYVDYIKLKNEKVDTAGLLDGNFTLNLGDVFVELSLRSQPAHTATNAAIPQQSFDEIATYSDDERFNIWQYLSRPKEYKNNIVIVGPPGSGKTTLLRHISIVMAGSSKVLREYKIDALIPIFLRLRKYIEEIVYDDVNIADLVIADLKHSLDEEEQSELIDEWVSLQLRSGDCIVMLDGLDEVANPDERIQVSRWVEKQMSSVAFGKNFFIITSRPYGYRVAPLNNVDEIEVRSFSQEQVKKFVHSWYLAVTRRKDGADNKRVRQRATSKADNLLQKLRDTSALASLSANPLLLTMITTVHEYHAQLPDRRVELYREIFKVFLGRWRAAREVEVKLSQPQMLRVLRKLGYYMTEKQVQTVNAEQVEEVISDVVKRVVSDMSTLEFLKEVEQISGLILEQEVGKFGFAHLTFQEYLAALHVKEDQLGDLVVVLQTHVSDTWWHETIRLYVAQADATPIISACLREENPSTDAIILALECQEEIIEIDANVRDKLEEWLVQGTNPESPYRKFVSDALLKRNLLNTRSVLVEQQTKKLQLSNWISHAEFQVFIDEQNERNRAYFLDHWHSSVYEQAEALEPAVGLRTLDVIDFVKWINQRSENAVWSYRLPKLAEVAHIQLDYGIWICETEDDSLVIYPGRNYKLTRKDTKQQIELDLNLLNEYIFKPLIHGLYKPDTKDNKIKALNRALDLAADTCSIEDLQNAYGRAPYGSVRNQLELIINMKNNFSHSEQWVSRRAYNTDYIDLGREYEALAEILSQFANLHPVFRVFNTTTFRLRQFGDKKSLKKAILATLTGALSQAKRTASLHGDTIQLTNQIDTLTGMVGRGDQENLRRMNDRIIQIIQNCHKLEIAIAEGLTFLLEVCFLRSTLLLTIDSWQQPYVVGRWYSRLQIMHALIMLSSKPKSTQLNELIRKESQENKKVNVTDLLNIFRSIYCQETMISLRSQDDNEFVADVGLRLVRE